MSQDVSTGGVIEAIEPEGAQAGVVKKTLGLGESILKLAEQCRKYNTSTSLLETRPSNTQTSIKNH